MPWSELGRVLIVSPHPLFREGIVRLLGDQAEVVGVVASLAEARSAIRKHRPQAIIVDHENVELEEADLAPLLWPELESVRIIYVTLAGNEMIIHDRQRVVAATEKDLLDALKGASYKRQSPKESLREAHPRPAQRAPEIPERGGIMRKLTVPLLITVVLSVPVALWFWRTDLTPELAAREGQPIDFLLRLEFAIAGVIFVLCMVFFFYSLVVFRRAPGDLEDGPPVHGSTPLEVAWTVIPAIIVIGLASYAAGILWDIMPTTGYKDELVVDVTGFQWGWRFEYPDLGITSSELVLPVNRPVLFRLYSVDVIHSFWIPELRIKMDNIPGIENHLRLTPTKVGEYKVRCAELCGTAHAYMLAPVKVVEQSAFEEWVKSQTAAAPAPPTGAAGVDAQAAERGRALAQQFGCLGCHSTDGTKLVGPTWKGLFGSTRTFQDGSTRVADEEYIRESILNPSAYVVEGFPDVMPKNFKDQLSEDQIRDLVEFIKTLQ